MSMRSFFQCQDCGFTFVRPFEPERYALYYSTLSHTYHVQHDGDTSRYRMVLRQLDLSEMRRVLDWGCGTGTFLSLLPPWTEKFGVELCLSAVGEARRNGVRIISQTETQEGTVAESFDAVTAIDVVEHLPDLISFRRTVARLLRPGGLFVVLTGDLDSRPARVLGRYWYYLHYSEHISFLTERAARQWLEPDFEDIRSARVSHHPTTIQEFVRTTVVFPAAWFFEKIRLAERLRTSAMAHSSSDHMLVCARRRP
jgi:2-polyprenyl-3-methyl-5-hydroxy-6-metoxy-1,4-benzoquinol methylase